MKTFGFCLYIFNQSDVCQQDGEPKIIEHMVDHAIESCCSDLLDFGKRNPKHGQNPKEEKQNDKSYFN